MKSSLELLGCIVPVGYAVQPIRVNDGVTHLGLARGVELAHPYQIQHIAELPKTLTGYIRMNKLNHDHFVYVVFPTPIAGYSGFVCDSLRL